MHNTSVYYKLFHSRVARTIHSLDYMHIYIYIMYYAYSSSSATVHIVCIIYIYSQILASMCDMHTTHILFIIISMICICIHTTVVCMHMRIVCIVCIL